MMNNIISNYKFDSYIVDSIDFSTNSEYDNNTEIEIDFNLNIDVAALNDKNKGKVTIKTTIFDEAKANNYPFSLVISLSGYFSVDDGLEISRDDFIKFLQLNGATTLFPFLRSIVVDITKTANVAPLVLPLFNVHNIIDTEGK